MRYNKMATVALSVILSGGMLSAESGHTGGKESYGKHTEVKRSAGLKRTDRDKDAHQRLSKTPKERTPEVRYKINRPPETVHRIVKQEAEVKRKRPPVQKELKRIERPHHWIPPKTKPLPPHRRPGYVIRTIPKVAMTLTLGGLLFYYSDGIYYRHHDSGFVVIVPPIGLIVPVLPPGYTVFSLHGSTYYYYADVYYVWDIHHRAYRVVEAPEAYERYQPGDIVDTLPDGTYTVTIDGVQYYRYNGIYFMQAIQGERIVYIVVTP
ncbi:DUF6515 family protein [Sulfurimonas sp. HSL3-7]|uniref:DUF6515 family protein n=1 Tax=Sulfonitrofixus jiaomeiensis TaxID=3131938 RepID=UPI0031F759BD